MTEPTIRVQPVQQINCTIDEALFFLTPEFIDEHIVVKEYPTHQTVLDLVDALRWQRWQIDRYRKLQTKTTECAMEALRDRDDALMKLEQLGAKP
jgi:hypothetical protein